jgi:hypothetical protein
MFSKTKTAFPAAIAIHTGVSTMNQSLLRTVRLSCWSQVKRYLIEWRLRARSRRQAVIKAALVLWYPVRFMKECAPLSRSNVPLIMLYDDDGIYSLAQCWPQRAAKAAKLDQEIQKC